MYIIIEYINPLRKQLQDHIRYLKTQNARNSNPSIVFSDLGKRIVSNCFEFHDEIKKERQLMKDIADTMYQAEKTVSAIDKKMQNVQFEVLQENQDQQHYEEDFFVSSPPKYLEYHKNAYGFHPENCSPNMLTDPIHLFTTDMEDISDTPIFDPQDYCAIPATTTATPDNKLKKFMKILL
jgi:hypothetical protein